MLQKSLQTVILLFFVLTISAQQGAVGGMITDAETKIPLTGASINIGNNKGDNSDLFGQFKIGAVSTGQYELIVSHIGYKTQIVPVEIKTNLLSSIEIKLRKEELKLAEIKINSKTATGFSTIGAVDIQLRPIRTSQDVLRIVPGLFIAQHAGGGKAEQIFLRGFDIDHGTDISITVDGLPVNMVSHAHGQGYADLHFLIPETVNKINFDKGPYFANQGNLATAAYVDFSTKDFLEKNIVKTEIGQFNTKRLMGMIKVLNKATEKARQQLYLASEFAATDGYFESPQHFHRMNVMGKYSAWFGNQSQLTIIGSHFDSKWNASGQVPDRAIKSGLINRFGSIDNNEGGTTSRSNFSIQFNKRWKSNWKTTDQFYFSNYHFKLYSDFTFFLEDSINGDMIRQQEERNLFGYTTTAKKTYYLGNKKLTTEAGSGFRYDNIAEIELAKASRTIFFNSIQKGAVKELNSFFYINQDIELSDKVNLNAGIRYDNFIFNYQDKLAGATDFNRQKRGSWSPKLNISFSPSAKIKIYLNNGIGFHSNDARLILSKQAGKILPKVFGTDLGVILKPDNNIMIKTAIWHLFSEEEFVYVGDAGIIEPSGKSRRIGIDLSLRYQFNKWLFGDIDLNLTKARSLEEVKGENFIPLAPSFTSIGGLTAKNKKGFSGSLRYRFIDKRPANENNSVQATGYLLLDMIVSYELRKFEFSISGENMLNSNWREAQFNTTSRLKNETIAVNEIHYTPGTPRYIKAGVSYTF